MRRARAVEIPEIESGDEMTTKRRGRPTRAEASAKAMRTPPVALPASIDARGILRLIASDASQPATARVQACRILLADEQGKPDGEPDSFNTDAVTRRALRLMRGREVMRGREAN
jgi:hypothetical protein